MYGMSYVVLSMLSVYLVLTKKKKKKKKKMDPHRKDREKKAISS